MRKFLFSTLIIVSSSIASMAQMLPYQNPNLSAQERAEDLCSRLTLEEKAKIMMDRSPKIDRLGIPEFHWWNEALHGVGRNGISTVYPITMCMASSWNDALLYKVFDAVSDELRAKNTLAHQNGTYNRYRGVSIWTPNINIFRDPRWGRGQETYGEDPYLTARMGSAVVRGLQGPADAKYRKTYACAKHFAVHSGPEWNRHSFDVQALPERDLWETYLPAFKTLVQDAGVKEVMCAYQRIDGDPCCGNTRYLQQILRNEWNFDGLVVSDCGAVSDFHLKGHHEVTPDSKSSASKAVLSGTDVECGSVYKSLPEAVKAGQITEAQIDISVKRLLKARFELGDFDSDDINPWAKIPTSVIACNEHKQLALEMARQGIVLLENKTINNVPTLPLSKDAKIAVVGPNADNEMMMWGNYNGFPTETITYLKGLTALSHNITYLNGCNFTRNNAPVSLYSKITNEDGTSGLKATYWNNDNFEGAPATTAVYEKALNLNNGGNTVFAPGVELTHFTARYKGSFTPEKSESLLFTCNADDRMRVILNGDTICDVWKTREKINLWKKDVNVEGGKKYDIVVEYMQGDAYASIFFDISKMVTTSPQEIVNKTKDCDYVVFCGGISPQLEGEEMKVDEPGFKGGDRTSIELPQSQRDVIKALADAGHKVIFVNSSGCAVALAQEKELCAAVIQAWYPGEKGGQALAEIIYGDVNPMGKLPITFYASDNDLPDFLDYTMKNRTYRYFKGTPLWAFGHGLSYTSFTIGKPKYKNSKLTLSIANTGKRKGTETIQVYIRRIADAEGPSKTLRAFKKVNLEAGETQSVDIDLPREQFECWDSKSNTMRVIPGKYEIQVGNASNDANMKSTIVNIK